MSTPDFDLFRDTILRRRTFDRVPLFELGVAPEHMDRVRQLRGGLEPLGKAGWADMSRKNPAAVEFWKLAGYDYIRPALGFGFTMDSTQKGDDPDSDAEREWVNEAEGDIKDRESFESYPWPTVDDIIFDELAHAADHCPDGMGVIIAGGGGFLEWPTQLMGLTPYCMALYQDPDLVRDMHQRVGEHILTVVDRAFQVVKADAFVIGDDMGFNTATMTPPDSLRELVLPWHRKLADLVHSHGALYLLHSCGQLSAIMDDLIDDVKIDGKHSFEDKITPVWEAKRLWGDRVAILGGVDMDVLSRAPEAECRAHIRRVLSDCAPDGGYALGSGNTVANYIKSDNYLAMLDEAERWGRR